MSIMKSATYGFGEKAFFSPTHKADSLGQGGTGRPIAVAAYRASRQNGVKTDSPARPLPLDGSCTWHERADGKYQVKYTEGPGDREWMEQCDRNYLARLDREKQSAARKQECEAQLREQDCSGSPTPQAGSSSAGTGGYSLDSPSLRPPPPIPTTTFSAEVLYSFQGASTEELTLSAGAKVRVVDRVSPEWWQCEHDGQAGLVPSQYLRTLSSAQVPSASPAGYTGYTTPTSGEALGTAGIFPAITPSSAANQFGRPEEELDYQMYSSQ
jgi:SH3 domain